MESAFLNEQDVTLQIKNLNFRFLLLSQMIIRFSYGLSKVKEAFYTPLSDKSFYSLEFNFEDYNSLYEYILNSSKHAIDLAFIKGITCNGKKIKFQK